MSEIEIDLERAKAEIARLRAALEVFTAEQVHGFWVWENPIHTNGRWIWIYPAIKDPSAFARNILAGTTTPPREAVQ